MLSHLLLNLCVLVTLIYLLSLTYRSAQDMLSRQVHWQRVALLSLLAVALMLYPAEIAPGIIIDMRSVPIAYLALRKGVRAGLIGLIPLLLYRLHLGGAGVLVAAFSAVSVVVAAGLLGRSVNLFAPRLDVPNLWWRLLLVFVPNGVLLPVLRGDMQAYLTVYLPLLALSYTGFWISLGILRSRFRLLQLVATYAQQARRDHLSDLPNRRQFDQDVASMEPADLLCLLDIDHFKAINDTHGHAVGDEVLTQLGQVLQSQLRASDQAYRYGGEEFAVIFRTPGSSAAAALAERLRQAVENTRFAALPGGRVTVSAGIARRGDWGTEGDCFQRADAALYAAKAGGRNRSVIWSPELGEGAGPNS